ncbi:expressed unknown protein [Seminavis robusta]|uniref:Uncharacterized protein n=1 Tax=Seminavis robusta TaxID=568900 RepID=A0A9N8DVK5_9STRA|nr:expressed unknown protein [Seminavis robusta]|eukprot:Sro405_g136060.1 n/a (444) ;mRNA; f:15886-17217
MGSLSESMNGSGRRPSSPGTPSTPSKSSSGYSIGRGAVICLMVLNLLGMGYQIIYQPLVQQSGVSVAKHCVGRDNNATSITNTETERMSSSSAATHTPTAPPLLPTTPAVISNQTTRIIGWIRPDVVYGLIHIPKVVGTEINGLLAAQYERVCGNKGYSFDAAQSNRHVGNTNLFLDKNNSDRNNVLPEEMLARGFEDCDYIALEEKPDFWTPLFQQLGPIELHVPCREPLQHLRSMCNYANNWRGIRRIFNCSATDLRQEVQNCDAGLFRLQQSFRQQPNMTALKCFDPLPPQRYTDYMGDILQPKRLPSEYVHRETNLPHDKSFTECIWNQTKEWQDNLLQIMRKHWYYYNFCHSCLGSKHDLFATTTNKKQKIIKPPKQQRSSAGSATGAKKNSPNPQRQQPIKKSHPPKQPPPPKPQSFANAPKQSNLQPLPKTLPPIE